MKLTTSLIWVGEAGCTSLCDETEQCKEMIIMRDNYKELQRVLVIPLYYESRGIGIGVEGKGFKFHKYVIKKPFYLNSREAIKYNSTFFWVTSFPPHFFVYNSNYAIRWLLVKDGYAQRLLKHDECAKNVPVVMSDASKELSPMLIRKILLADKKDSAALKDLFGVASVEENIPVKFSTRDVEILVQELRDEYSEKVNR